MQYVSINQGYLETTDVCPLLLFFFGWFDLKFDLKICVDKHTHFITQPTKPSSDATPNILKFSALAHTFSKPVLRTTFSHPSISWYDYTCIRSTLPSTKGTNKSETKRKLVTNALPLKMLHVCPQILAILLRASPGRPSRTLGGHPNYRPGRLIRFR